MFPISSIPKIYVDWSFIIHNVQFLFFDKLKAKLTVIMANNSKY